ncbi:universal stress protein [Herminiimonas sp. CN]|uniref:universal stress protein n=1 Tax=Herminiimonas sp. CN TaxID=1349818 RepID=UPI0004738E5E|nr:universal stress protein [Herminiimonas sp. CN]
MYQKILIPTDGSEFSNIAAQAGVEFARQLNAEVFGIYVAPEYQYPIYVEIIPPSYPSEEDYKESMRKAGEMYLQTIQKAAEAAGLKFTGIIEFADTPAKNIAHAAKANHCDLIFMGSHGRGGWGQLILGSVTSKVLSLCKIPVLVYRVEKASASQPA